jgi:hypothetical protein
MVYLAFIHGASGAVFFKYDGSAPGLDRAPTSTLLWDEASKLALQLAEIGPSLAFFNQGAVSGTVSDVPVDIFGTANEGQPMAVNSSSAMVHASARKTLDGLSLLIIAVNTANDPTTKLTLVTAALPTHAAGAATLECVQLFTYGERCDSPTQIECTSGFRPVAVKLLSNGQVEVQDVLEALGTRVYRVTYIVTTAEDGDDRTADSNINLERLVPLANSGFERSTNAGTADSWFVTVGSDPDASAVLDHFTYYVPPLSTNQQSQRVGNASSWLAASLRLTTPSLLGAASFPADPHGGSAVCVQALWCDNQQWCTAKGLRGNPCQCKLDPARYTLRVWAKAPPASTWSIAANNGSTDQRLQLDFGAYATIDYDCIIESPSGGVHTVPPSTNESETGWKEYATVGVCHKTVPPGIPVAAVALLSAGQVWIDNLTLTQQHTPVAVKSDDETDNEDSDPCLAKQNDFCNTRGQCSKVQSGCGAHQTFFALNDKGNDGKSSAWRCYAANNTNANHSAYVSGRCYCTRDVELSNLLCKCDPAHCNKPAPPVPAPPPPIGPPPPPPPPPLPTPTEAKNVLFMAVDDMRPMMHKAYNFSLAVTPNMDKLATEGLTFTRAYCNYAVCSPSRNSFMSGRRRKCCSVLTSIYQAPKC